MLSKDKRIIIRVTIIKRKLPMFETNHPTFNCMGLENQNNKI